MGILIQGDPRQEQRWNIPEIAEASGISRSTLRNRCKQYGIEITAKGYTYAQVQQMIRKPKRQRSSIDRKNVAKLKSRLQADGAI